MVELPPSQMEWLTAMAQKHNLPDPGIPGPFSGVLYCLIILLYLYCFIQSPLLRRKALLHWCNPALHALFPFMRITVHADKALRIVLTYARAENLEAPAEVRRQHRWQNPLVKPQVTSR